MSVAHPIPYQGSKRALAAYIISYFPQDLGRVIEPFAGSAAVSLAAAYYHKANNFLLADNNQALVTLWDEIIYKPEAISNAYETLWQSQQGNERKFYNEVRTQFNKTQRPDLFLYLLARCVKASIRYNPRGEFNQSPDNRRKGARPATMKARIVEASYLLRGKVELICADYRQVLSIATDSDIVYMDPPYQGIYEGKDHRYLSGLSFEEFVESLCALNNSKISYIVSYDGYTGEKAFGKPLPDYLDLVHIEVKAGKSSQATLLGRSSNTVESLYLSPSLISRLSSTLAPKSKIQEYQYPLVFSH